MSIEKFSPDSPPAINEKQDVELALEAIRQMETNKETLGEGRAALVFAAPGSSICVKQITHFGQEFSTNDAKGEMALLSQSAQAGVRVPRPISTVESKKGTYILMEKIDGYSIKDILVDNIPLPDSFDFDELCHSLDVMMQKLHRAGIYHRDLHEGNVMIEWSTGRPVLIDFGKSCTTFSEADDPYLVVDYPKQGQRYTFPGDDNQLAQIKRRLVTIFTRRRK